MGQLQKFNSENEDSRSERPLDIVKLMDCNDWTQSSVLRDYLRLTYMLKIPTIDLSLNPKKFKTIKEWDKNLENIKMKTKKASMTSLLTHTIAHSTRPSYRSKVNSQSLRKFLSR